VVRDAREDELDLAGAVVREAYGADATVPPGYARLLADARERARDADVAVALSDGRVVGSVTFVLPGSRWAELSRPGEAEFRMLGVDPAFRGCGVGQALVTWCVARARDVGAGRLLLCSVDSMASAHRLYTRTGFERVPDLDFSPRPGVRLIAFARVP
jgi:GNAT superfamily N-acetyltransferase